MYLYNKIISVCSCREHAHALGSSDLMGEAKSSTTDAN